MCIACVINHSCDSCFVPILECHALMAADSFGETSPLPNLMQERREGPTVGSMVPPCQGLASETIGSRGGLFNTFAHQAYILSHRDPYVC